LPRVEAAGATGTTIADEIASFEFWYHTLELAPGQLTPGWLDTRPVVPHVPFPESLEGKRCLDIGTYDGFWAFEMERRGAAEVVAIDVLDARQWDWPVTADPATIEDFDRRKARGRGFEIAKRQLGSSVERRELSVYDLDPDEIGQFDLVYIGSLLVHLQNPVRAVEAARRVCSGSLIVVDGVDLPLSLMFPRHPIARLDGRGVPWWWYANAAGLGRMVEAGGFEITDGPRRIFMPIGAGQPLPRFSPGLLRTRDGREKLILARKGDPHAVVAARPRG
jgi:tRNA (mo5U34)-methyltransferase